MGRTKISIKRLLEARLTGTFQPRVVGVLPQIGQQKAQYGENIVLTRFALPCVSLAKIFVPPRLVTRSWPLRAKLLQIILSKVYGEERKEFRCACTPLPLPVTDLLPLEAQQLRTGDLSNCGLLRLQFSLGRTTAVRARWGVSFTMSYWHLGQKEAIRSP